MKIPKITINFDSFLAETEKAILIRYDNKEVWLPKSICSDLKITGKILLNGTTGHGSVNIAPFKYTELTGVVPQPMDMLIIKDIEYNLIKNNIEDYDIVEPKGIYLREKQIEKIIKIKRLKCFFIYGQMRTGKTVVTTTIAESRLKAGIINKIIVIAPLRTQKVWENHLSVDFIFHATEHFSNEYTRNAIHLECDNRTMVILDESHQIKNIGTIRTDYIIKQTNLAGHKCILTGTPIGKHAGDLYFQFYFLDPAILDYSSYRDFEESHLLYGGRDGKKVVAYTNIEEISNKISHYTIKMSRSEMGIDRKKIYSIESYAIKNQQKYDSLKEKYNDFFEKGMNFPMLGYMVKLQQCANGYIFDSDDNCVGYEDNGRFGCLGDILKKHRGESIVIYFKYNEDLMHLKELKIPLLSGKTKRKEFDETIDKFNAGDIKIIGLQQQMSIGFSLRACDIMIYYSRKFGSISSAQSEDRACESVEKPLHIIDISGRYTIDEAIKATINKQFDIINLFKKEIKNEN